MLHWNLDQLCFPLFRKNSQFVKEQWLLPLVWCDPYFLKFFLLNFVKFTSVLDSCFLQKHTSEVWESQICCVNQSKMLHAQANKCFNHPSKNGYEFCSSLLCNCALVDPAVIPGTSCASSFDTWTNIDSFFPSALPSVSVSVCCGVPCAWIISCQGLCFCDCPTPRAPTIQGIHRSGWNGAIDKICRILTFLVFWFLFGEAFTSFISAFWCLAEVCLRVWCHLS